MNIYDESKNCVALYSDYGMTAYVKLAKMTWSQDNKERDIITFIGIKDKDNNTVIALNFKNKNNFWFYDEKGYINIVDEIENIMLFFTEYNNLNDYTKNKKIESIFFDHNMTDLHIFVKQIKRDLQKQQDNKEHKKIENDINNLVYQLKEKYADGNYKFCKDVTRICVIKFDNKYTQKRY